MVQTKLNPPAADPVQQRCFSLMPIVHLHVLHLASAL